MAIENLDNINNPNEGYLNAGLRNLFRVGISKPIELGLGAPGNIADLLLNAIKGTQKTQAELFPQIFKPMPLPERLPIPTSKDIHKYVTKPVFESVLPKGYTKAQAPWEEKLDFWGSDLPLSFILPGGVAKNVIRSLGSSALMKTGEQLGVGPEGQMVLGAIGGSLGQMGKAAVKGASPKQLISYADKTRKVAYNRATDVAKKNTYNTSNLKTKFGQLVEEALADHETPGIKSVRKNLINAYNKLNSNGQTLINDVWTDKKRFMQDIKSLKFGSPAANYTDRAITMLHDSLLNEAGLEYPTFGADYKLGNELTSAIKSKPEFAKMVSKSRTVKNAIKENPLAARLIESTIGAGAGALATATSGSLAKGVFAGVATGLVAEGIRKGGKLLSKRVSDLSALFRESPALREHFKDLMLNSANQNPAAVATSIARINSDINHVLPIIRNEGLKFGATP